MVKLKSFGEMNESNFPKLEDFFKDLLTTFKVEAKDTRGILLDVVGGFGFKQETIVVDSAVLAKEVEKTEEVVDGYLDDVYRKHKAFIRKRLLRDGSISYTYR
jgi:hypothetical protein